MMQIPPYVPPFTPTPNITPFTYRDGMTYLARLEGIVNYVNEVIVPYVNTGVSDIDAKFTAAVQQIIEVVNLAIEAQTADVDAKITELEETVESAVQSILNDSIVIQDPLVAQMVADDESATRVALDLVFAEKTLVDSMKVVLDAVEAALTTGRLSEDTLDDIFANIATEISAKASQTDLDALADVVDDKASKATQTTVDTGRLSEASLAPRFAEAKGFVIDGKYGGPALDSRFAKLHAGIIKPSNDVRVIVLGSSNANAHLSAEYVSKTDKACYQRLARRANAGAQLSLESVITAVPAGGHKWWNGAQGNTTTVDYYPTARRNKVAFVVPDYVIHQIGENDYFYGTTIANFKANLRNAFEHVEGVNPNVLNVYVYGYGRTDVTTPVAAWSAYGAAAKEVVDESPNTRLFINASQFFEPLGTLSSDQGEVLFDTVHLNDNGNKLAANIIGAYLGIPSESDRQPTNTFDFPIAGGTYTGIAQPVSEVWFAAANYPREVDVIGNLWANFSNTGGYLDVLVVDLSSTTVDKASITTGSVGAQTLALSSSLYIPPGVGGVVRLSANPSPGNVVVQSGTGGLSKARAIFRPV